MNPENETPSHLGDPTKARVISREEWAFHQQTIDAQTQRDQYPGYVVLESDERGH